MAAPAPSGLKRFYLVLAAVAVLAGLVIALFALEARPRLHRKQI